MPDYTVEAFRWSGTGYGGQYNTSYTATFSDNDGAYQGSGDSNETVQIDGGSANATQGQPYKIAISFTDTSGNSHVEDFNFFYTSDGGWHFIPEPGSEFTVGATLGVYQSHSVGWNYSDVVCFVSGTRITTPKGKRKVETLKVGDLITCQDGTQRRLTQVLSRRFTRKQLARHENLRPVRITAGSLGLGLPTQDLVVSRQHRILTKSRISKRLFGTEEALVAAIKLTVMPGIYVETEARDVEYFHLGFETHEVIFAEDAPAESLLREDDAILANSPEARQELSWLLPDSTSMFDERDSQNIPSPKLQKTILAKHRDKGRALRK